jgi:uncharacterized membrane protein YwaF
VLLAAAVPPTAAAVVAVAAAVLLAAAVGLMRWRWQAMMAVWRVGWSFHYPPASQLLQHPLTPYFQGQNLQSCVCVCVCVSQITEL